MSRGTALALSAMIGNVRRRRVGAQDLHGLDPADAGQVDVHQDHVRLIGARKLDAEIAIRRAQQAQVGAARDELLDQFQVGRVVFHVEQRAQRRAVRHLRPRQRRTLGLREWQAAVRSSGSIRSRTRCPRPTVLSTPMVPPISSTSRLVTTRPMPVPSSALASLPRRLNGWNSCASCSGASPAPVSRTLMRIEARGTQRALDDHRASRLVVLDCVEQQVDQDLLDPGPVGLDEVGDLEARKRHADAALLRLRLDHGPALEHDLGQRHRLARQRQLARLDQREVEDFVDQLQQVPAGLEDLVDVVASGTASATARRIPSAGRNRGSR